MRSNLSCGVLILLLFVVEASGAFGGAFGKLRMKPTTEFPLISDRTSANYLVPQSYASYFRGNNRRRMLHEVQDQRETMRMFSDFANGRISLRTNIAKER
jgi:hypothetical protein